MITSDPLPPLLPDHPAASIVLASASQTRRAMLAAAGVPVSCQPAYVDEAELKKSLTSEGVPPRDIADFLAEMKAVKVSNSQPAALTIGSDQVLVLGNIMFDKPADLDHVRAHLRAFRGKTHELVSAVVVAEGGRPVWRHISRARLTMRALSDAFIEAYIASAGDAVLSCVGAYQIEHLGAQLFDKIEGDHFTILGLPLLPLLDYLRQRGALLS